eukprot:TRINITY_DN93173_c0_g1_i1.p1 TRINITY_DN93173_c0_g1~~TRINITY_DN93173_c0_g1_i1.p1  ORF type:complete len:559 (-),score=116.38 TRINITY_DN93173_c0_g1_i1:94-1770(-)
MFSKNSRSLCFTAVLLILVTGRAADEMETVSSSFMQKGLRSIKTKVNTEVQQEIKSDSSTEEDDVSAGVCALADLAQTSTPLTCTDCHSAQSEKLEKALISEIKDAFGGNHAQLTEQRLKKVEGDIWPLFSTLPQEAGGLGLSAARYLVHQYFLRKYRWYIRGLNPAGDSRKDESVEEAVRGHVAGQLLEVLEKEVGTSGLGLRVLSVFVATLEHLIHSDERERFKATWKLHKLSTASTTDTATLVSVLEMFVGHYLYTSQQRRSGYALTWDKAKQELNAMKRAYDGWEDIEGYIKDAVDKVPKPISLNNSISAADEVLNNFNRVSGAMCGTLKHHLMSGAQGSGQPLLRDLRAKSMDFFRETDNYLQALGALDNTDPFRTKVLVPNYLYGPSNCDGTTSFYDLCCPNECEMKLERLESLMASNLKKNSASAIEEALEVQLSEEQRQTLTAITQHGHSFLHGGPFAKFLHTVFPSECPRPRLDDFSSKDGDSVPDAHMSFQKAALLERWSMTRSELNEIENEVLHSLEEDLEAVDIQEAPAVVQEPIRLTTNLRGGRR